MKSFREEMTDFPMDHDVPMKGSRIYVKVPVQDGALHAGGKRNIFAVPDDRLQNVKSSRDVFFLRS